MLVLDTEKLQHIGEEQSMDVRNSYPQCVLLLMLHLMKYIFVLFLMWM